MIENNTNLHFTMSQFESQCFTANRNKDNVFTFHYESIRKSVSGYQYRRLVRFTFHYESIRKSKKSTEKCYKEYIYISLWVNSKVLQTLLVLCCLPNLHFTMSQFERKNIANGCAMFTHLHFTMSQFERRP